MSREQPDNDHTGFGAMVPDREDIAIRKSTQEKPDSNGRKKKTDSNGKKGDSQFPWIASSLIVLALLTGFMYWQNYRLHQSLQSVREENSLAQARLSVLENQLTTTDENLVMNEANIKGQLNFHMSEIRKLWDVSNKRNKDWIEENQAAVQRLTAARTSLEKELSALKTSQAGISGKLDRTSEQASQMESRLDRSLSVINPKLEELALTQNLQSDQLQALEAGRGLESMRQQLTDLNSEVAGLKTLSSTVSQDIESINNFRLQVNQRLVGLQDQIRALESRLAEQP